ncbi:hypothetical protein BDR07DRAFT_556101 [Suillus spraguei]|nr:hypothetical protein BDR07DRAFT_556101 [Suillus spraguei]
MELDFRCDSAQSADVTTVTTSAAHRPECAPVPRSSVVATSKLQGCLDCTEQESHRLPIAVEYSASERGTASDRSEITGFREVVNVDGWSDHSSPPPESPAQSVHAAFVQDVLPLRRYSYTGITTPTSVNHPTNRLLSTSATSHSSASNVVNPQFTNSSNLSPKDNSQFTSTHYSLSSQKVSSDSSLAQSSTAFSRGTWAGTQGIVSCLCTLGDTQHPQSKSANCPVHPAMDMISISASSGDFGHVDQCDQSAYPAAQAHVWQRGAQHQEHQYQSKERPSRAPQPPTFPFTDSPAAQSHFVGHHADVDIYSTQYSTHGVLKNPTETSSEDRSTTTSEHGCDSKHSEHWQLVSRTTFDIEAQACDGAERNAAPSKVPPPITINPLDTGIVSGEVNLLPHPVPHTTSVSEVAGGSRGGGSRTAVQESTLERELIQENQAAATAVSQTTVTRQGELTSVIPCHRTPAPEEWAPLSTVTCISSLRSSGPQSPSEPNVPQDSGTDRIESGCEHQSLDVDTASKSSIQISSLDSTESSEKHMQRQGREEVDSSVLVQVSLAPAENLGATAPTLRTVENMQKSSLSSNDLRSLSSSEDTVMSMTSQTSSSVFDLKGGSCDHIVGMDPLAESFSEGRHELETESESKLSSTTHSYSIKTVERSTSETTVSKIDRQMDQDTDVLTLPSSQITMLPPSSPGVPQDAGADSIQSGCEHMVDMTSTTLVQTSIHDFSTESKGYQPARSSSCGDEPETVLSTHVCLSLAQNNSSSPPSMDKAVENAQTSSNGTLNSSFTMATSQSYSLVASEEHCSQDITKDQPNEGSFSAKHEVDEGVTTDRMHQAVIELGCKRQSSEVNEVSKTLESEHTWSHQSSEWHIQRQVLQHVHSSSAVVLQVEESNTTPPHAVKNTEASSLTPDDLRNSPMSEGTLTIDQALAGDCLQETPDHDMTKDACSSQSSSIPKFEDNKVDLSETGCAYQVSVTGGNYREREKESEVEQNSTYHLCNFEMRGKSTSETATGNKDMQMDKDADDITLPLSLTTIRPKPSISEPDILQDTTASSMVITVLTTSMQTSGHNSTISGGHVRRQPVQTSTYSDEPPVDYKVNQSPFLAPGESNPILAQSISIVSENTQQLSTASNDIMNSSLPEGVSTKYHTSFLVECGELCGQDGARNLLSKSSSTLKLKDNKEGMAADCTCQVMEDTRNCKSDTTDGHEKESREGADIAVLISSSPNSGLEGPPSEPSVLRDAATNNFVTVQSEHEYNFTEDSTVSVTSVHASSNCFTNSGNGYTCLDSSQQSNNPPGTMSILSMHDGSFLPPHAFYEVHDSWDCSCVPRVIASPVSNEGDSTAVSASGAFENIVSSNDDHSAPCAERTLGVKPQQDGYTKAEPTIISTTFDSNTIRQTENQNHSSSAAETRRCGAQGPACATVSILSTDYGASIVTTAPHDSPSADEQLTHRHESAYNLSDSHNNVDNDQRSSSSHKMSGGSSLPQSFTAFSCGTWAGTQGSPVSCLCTLDNIRDTSQSKSNSANCPVHPAMDTISTSASSGDSGHVDQCDQSAHPAAQADVWQCGAQHQQCLSKERPNHTPQSPTFPFTDSPTAQSLLVGHHADVDIRPIQYSSHGVLKNLTETSSEDRRTTSEHVCDSKHGCNSEHWQLVSRTAFDIEAQACDGAECNMAASEFPAPITINPLNAGIVSDEVNLLPHPVPHITSVSQVAGDSRRRNSCITVQESTIERELTQENQVAATVVFQTTSTGELTSIVPCCGTLVAEECVSTATYALSLPPSGPQSTQTISCSDSSITDDRHHEYADSSVLVRTSATLEENKNPTPTLSKVIAVENTQKSSSTSNDLQNSPLVQSTLTVAESTSLGVDRHEEPCSQDVVKYRPTEVSYVFPALCLPPTEFG